MTTGLVLVDSGRTTKSVAGSTGSRTPPHRSGGTGPTTCPALGSLVYGAPYVALVLVPSSSDTAVVTKSTSSMSISTHSTGGVHFHHEDGYAIVCVHLGAPQDFRNLV
jgi:hypothetical protein